MTLRYASPYGGFSADGWQYEINTPDTPREWFNLLANRTFLAEVSQVGRGRSYYLAPSVNTVSRGGRAFYLRDRDTGEMWSPTGAPAGAHLVGYRCVHRPDCTVIESERGGVACRIRVFVPVQGTASIWTITLRNYTEERRNLSLFSYFPLQVTNRRWPGEFYNAARYDADTGVMLADARSAGTPSGLKYLGYAAANPRPDHTEGSEEAFLGGAGRWDRPAAVAAGRLADGAGLRERLAAAFQHDIVLDKNAAWTVHLAVGCEETRDEVIAAAARYTDPDAVEALFEENWLFWQNAAGTEWLVTPDDEVNLALNTWLKRQLVMPVLGRRWTVEINARKTPRRGSHTGAGAAISAAVPLLEAVPPSMPGASTLQDAVAFLPDDPAPCRRELHEAFSRQESSGFIPRDWPAVAALAHLLKPQGHGDIPIWAAWALAAYVNETADLAFLSEVLPYSDKKRTASVLEHAVAGLRFLAANVGQHHLCLFGEGDWNDPLEHAGHEVLAHGVPGGTALRKATAPGAAAPAPVGEPLRGVLAHGIPGGTALKKATAPETAAPAPVGEPRHEGRGESVRTSLGLVFAARALAPVARRAGQAAAADELQRLADDMAQAVNAAAWDGAWYIRGYADDGFRFGTHGEAEGRIYLNPQSWAVLSGTADPERAHLAMESVRRHLETECGTAILAPPYRHYHERIGQLTNKVPGTAENGSVYNHAALFHACALAALGQGDRAMDCFRRLLPTVRQYPVERSRHIPIWMPNYYVPPTCEHGGLASDLHLTGTVSWAFIFIREYIFGVRPAVDGLTIRPCLPAAWRECRMVRPFRSDVYAITIRNPHGLQTGRVQVEVDGRPAEGASVPFIGDGGRHDVLVTLEPESGIGYRVPDTGDPSSSSPGADTRPPTPETRFGVETAD